MSVQLQGLTVFEQEVRALVEQGMSSMDIPVSDMFRPLTTVDIEYMFVTSRIDWSRVRLDFPTRTVRGWAYLQSFYPGAPFGDLAPDLDISSCDNCILGGLWRDYELSLENQLYGPQFVVAHGFAGMHTADGTAVDDERELTAWWRDVLAHRYPGTSE